MQMQMLWICITMWCAVCHGTPVDKASYLWQANGGGDGGYDTLSNQVISLPGDSNSEHGANSNSQVNMILNLADNTDNVVKSEGMTNTANSYNVLSLIGGGNEDTEVQSLNAVVSGHIKLTDTQTTQSGRIDLTSRVETTSKKEMRTESTNVKDMSIRITTTDLTETVSGKGELLLSSTAIPTNSPGGKLSSFTITTARDTSLTTKTKTGATDAPERFLPHTTASDKFITGTDVVIADMLQDTTKVEAKTSVSHRTTTDRGSISKANTTVAKTASASTSSVSTKSSRREESPPAPSTTYTPTKPIATEATVNTNVFVSVHFETTLANTKTNSTTSTSTTTKRSPAVTTSTNTSETAKSSVSATFVTATPPLLFTSKSLKVSPTRSSITFPFTVQSTIRPSTSLLSTNPTTNTTSLIGTDTSSVTSSGITTKIPVTTPSPTTTSTTETTNSPLTSTLIPSKAVVPQSTTHAPADISKPAATSSPTTLSTTETTDTSPFTSTFIPSTAVVSQSTTHAPADISKPATTSSPTTLSTTETTDTSPFTSTLIPSKAVVPQSATHAPADISKPAATSSPTTLSTTKTTDTSPFTSTFIPSTAVVPQSTTHAPADISKPAATSSSTTLSTTETTDTSPLTSTLIPSTVVVPQSTTHVPADISQPAATSSPTTLSTTETTDTFPLTSTLIPSTADVIHSTTHAPADISRSTTSSPTVLLTSPTTTIPVTLPASAIPETSSVTPFIITLANTIRNRLTTTITSSSTTSLPLITTLPTTPSATTNVGSTSTTTSLTTTTPTTPRTSTHNPTTTIHEATATPATRPISTVPSTTSTARPTPVVHTSPMMPKKATTQVHPTASPNTATISTTLKHETIQDALLNITERCANASGTSFPYKDNCRAYWQCENEKPVMKCCPNKATFTWNHGCIPNPSCNPECDPGYDMSSMCDDRQKVEGNFHYYYRMVHKRALIRPCPDGTIFREELCRCDYPPTGFQDYPACHPKFEMTFDGNTPFEDVTSSGNDFETFHIQPTANGTGQFYDKSMVIIKSLNGSTMGYKFAVHLKFIAREGSDRMVLLSDCLHGNDGDSASVDIRLHTRNSEVVFRVHTYSSPLWHVQIPYKRNEWNVVSLIYEGTKIKASVNKSHKINPVFFGSLRRKQAGLVIGKCSDKDGFTGEMDDLMIFTDCVVYGTVV